MSLLAQSQQAARRRKRKTEAKRSPEMVERKQKSETTAMVLVLTKQKGKPGHTGVTFETGTPATITVKQLKHAIALRDKVRLSC